LRRGLKVPARRPSCGVPLRCASGIVIPLPLRWLAPAGQGAGVALGLLALAVVVVAACGPTAIPVPSEVAAPATPTIVYQMVQVKTRTPTPLPVTPGPTATFVPLITPSATVYQAPTANAAASVPRISVTAAKASLDAGTAVLVDVRTAAAYEQSHAVGAISMPSNEVETRYKELPADKQIILYCA